MANSDSIFKKKKTLRRLGAIFGAVLFPPFVKWLDTWLRLHYPIVWRTRIHHFIWFALLANPALYGLGCIYPAAAIPTFFIPLLKTISWLLLSLWALQQFHFPLGEFRPHEYLITGLLYTCCFFIFLITPVSFILPMIERVAVILGTEVEIFSLIQSHSFLFQISVAGALLLTLLSCIPANFIKRCLKIRRSSIVLLPQTLLWQPKPALLLDQYIRINRPLVWSCWRALDTKKIKVYIISLLLLSIAALIESYIKFIFKNEIEHYSCLLSVMTSLIFLIILYHPIKYLYVINKIRGDTASIKNNFFILLVNLIITSTMLYISMFLVLLSSPWGMYDLSLQHDVILIIFIVLAYLLLGCIFLAMTVCHLSCLLMFLSLKKAILLTVYGAIANLFIFAIFSISGNNKDNFVYYFFAFLFPFFLSPFMSKNYSTSIMLTCWSFIITPFILVLFGREIYPIYPIGTVVIAETTLYLAVISLSIAFLTRYKYWPTA
ncbi:hypothetical protein KKHLCK_06155 [Candidatus Electrothrix laxa]